MLMTKEKARQFTNFIRTLIRAEASAGILLSDEQTDAYKIFDNLANTIEDGFVDFLTSE